MFSKTVFLQLISIEIIRKILNALTFYANQYVLLFDGTGEVLEKKSRIMLRLDEVNIESFEHEVFGHIQRMKNELGKDEESNPEDANEKSGHIQMMKNKLEKNEESDPEDVNMKSGHIQLDDVIVIPTKEYHYRSCLQCKDNFRSCEHVSNCLIVNLIKLF